MEYAIGLEHDHKVDLRHQTASEQLGAYALDLHQNGEKVEWARTVNTGIDDPHWAIRAIEAAQSAEHPQAQAQPV